MSQEFQGRDKKRGRILTGILALLLSVGVLAGTSLASMFQTTDVKPADVVDEPIPIGSPSEVATGPTPGGDPWTLIAYDSDRGLCLEIRGVAPANGGGGGCIFDVPGKHSVSVNTEVFAEPAVTFVYGPLTRDVVAVAVSLDNGKTLNVASVPSPAGLKFQGRFYAAVVGGAPEVRGVAGKSATGTTVEVR